MPREVLPISERRCSQMTGGSLWGSLVRVRSRDLLDELAWHRTQPLASSSGVPHRQPAKQPIALHLCTVECRRYVAERGWGTRDVM